MRMRAQTKESVRADQERNARDAETGRIYIVATVNRDNHVGVVAVRRQRNVAENMIRRSNGRYKLYIADPAG